MVLKKIEKESSILDALFFKSESYYIWLDNLKNKNKKDEESLRKIVTGYNASSKQ